MRRDIGQARAVAVEAFQRLAALLMNARQNIAQTSAQLLRRVAADDRDQHGERPDLAPQAQVAEPQGVDPLLPGTLEGIPDEILDRRQHRGNELRVLARRVLRRDMRDQEARAAMDEKDVLDLVDERVVEHDLGEGLSGPPGFKPPAQPAPREALPERFVERLEGVVDCLSDRLADRRNDHGVENVNELPRIVADRAFRRLLQRRRQHLAQPRVARRDRRCQHASHGHAEPLGILDHLAQPAEHLDLAPDQQAAQLLKPRIDRRHAGR